MEGMEASYGTASVSRSLFRASSLKSMGLQIPALQWYLAVVKSLFAVDSANVGI